MIDVAWIRGHDGGVPLARDKRDVNVHDVGVTGAPTEQAHRAGGQIVERDYGHRGIAEKACHPRLPRTAKPGLRNGTRRDADGDLVFDGPLEQSANSPLAALQCQQPSGIKRQFSD